jgi:enoyl-CoA hydratase
MLTEEFIDELYQLLTSINDTINVVCFYGTKGSFAVGADLKTLQEFTATDAKYFSIKGNNLFKYIEKADFISIAEIDGYCMGGGIDFAASCDFRFATADSYFSHPGSNLGFITGFGGTARLPRISNLSFIRELFYTGNIFTSSDLKKSNFLYEIFDNYDLMNERMRDFTKYFINLNNNTIREIKLQLA